MCLSDLTLIPTPKEREAGLQHICLTLKLTTHHKIDYQQIAYD